jgi:hypothetical protein
LHIYSPQKDTSLMEDPVQSAGIDLPRSNPTGDKIAGAT